MFHFYTPKLKKTGAVNFKNELSVEIKPSQEILELLDMLTLSRKNLVHHFISFSHSKEDLFELSTKYISLLRGLVSLSRDIVVLELQNKVQFTWTNFTNIKVGSAVVQHLHFELVSMLLNKALWLLGHGAKVVADEKEFSDSIAKIAQESFLKAAGIIDMINGILLKVEEIIREPLSLDFKESILDALKQLCIAQAQEISVLRLRVNEKSSSILLSRIAYDTSLQYNSALTSLEQEPFGERKIVTYLEAKQAYCEGLCRFFQAKDLFETNPENVSEIISCYHAALHRAQISEAIFRNYAFEFPKLAESSPSANLVKTIHEALKTYESISETIQPSPYPPFPQPDCVAQPIPMILPSISSVWTPQIYGNFTHVPHNIKLERAESIEEIKIPDSPKPRLQRNASAPVKKQTSSPVPASRKLLHSSTSTTLSKEQTIKRSQSTPEREKKSPPSPTKSRKLKTTNSSVCKIL